MIDRRTLIVGTAAVAVPFVPASALPVQTLQYHPEDQHLADALDDIEAAINRIRSALAKGADATMLERVGYHCDARCALTALRMKVDMMTWGWTEQYHTMLAQTKS